MKTFQKVLMAALLLLGFLPRVHAAEIFKNDDLDISLGGRIQELGEMELVTDDSIRNHFRVYCWNYEDRLFTSGDYQGYKWNFEVDFGGEDVANSTNGSFDLLDAYVDIPLIPDMVTIKVGQFRDPTELESATYDGNQLFTEKSPNFNLFFNEGYDTGVALYGHIGNLDGAAGLVQGAPDLPQRYLPEIANIPLPMFLRIGYNDGITDDPFHQKQTGFAKPDRALFAIHANGYVAADSNAGHGDLFSQMGGGLATFNANSYFGNVLLSKTFNPYLGADSASTPVTENYYQAGLDFQFRSPLADTTFTCTGEVMIGHYDITVSTPMISTVPTGFIPSATIGPNGAAPMTAVPGRQYALNIGGGELTASIGDKPWELAGRLAVVIPDSGMEGPQAGGTATVITVAGTKYTGYFFNPIFPNGNPIWEVTFPSITWHMNDDCKLVAETMFMFNEAEAEDVDGNYVIAEMPGSATSSTAGYRANNIEAGFVPIARMMFQLQF